MNRRWLLAACLAFSGCSVLPSQPYIARRDWPLVVRRTDVRPSSPGAPALLVRSVRAGPGLGQRGLQVLRADGSLEIGYYNQWAVPPAEAVEDDLRHWLAGSGLFAGVVGPGSQLDPRLVLESELTVLLADPARHEARAAMSLVLLDRAHAGLGVNDRVLLQTTVHGSASLGGTDAPAEVVAMRAAVAAMLVAAEAAVAQHLPAK